MKTLGLVAFLFAVAAAAPAHADLTGHYSGQGSSIFHKSGHVRPCSQIFVSLVQKPTEIDVQASGYVCEDLQAEVDPYVLTIRGGHLISQEGLDIGMLDGNKLTLHYKDQAEGFTYDWQIKKSGAGVSFKEEWVDGEKPALTVQGDLKSTR